MVVYHWVPTAMTGSVLYPLNELRHRAPEVWERERAKYDGREDTLEMRVPPLDCLWNDVLHLSPVHPAKIVAALAEVGLEPLRRRSFEIDAEALDPKRTVIFLNRRASIADQIDESQWCGFDPKLIPHLSHVTEETHRYYRDCAQDGTRPLLYGYLPHVFFRGVIETRDLRVIDV